MLVDQARIFVKSGKGGNGALSFRREKYVPRGGPDGGDGGRGGDVILRVAENITSLLPFKYQQLFEAENGVPGAGRQRHGRKGKPKIVDVPAGTVVALDATDEQIADLTEPGEEFVICQGGRGGLGNVHFKSSTRRSPRIAELGEPGEERWLRLELRLIADVGLIGLPNAGKSTFLAASTRAKPKIADYPFTTLAPNLGVVQVGYQDGQTFVMADIPGLIEGAAEGAGLGHAFLRHVHRTEVLVHVLDASGGLEGRDPLDDFRTINSEVFEFSDAMKAKPMVVVLNKVDLVEARDNLPRLREVLEGEGHTLFEISAATGEGIEAVHRAVAGELREITLREAEERKIREAAPRRRVYTIGNVDERAWDVTQTTANTFVVSGVGIERFARMTNFEQWESVNRFQRVLTRAGIFSELSKRGINEGDVVQIGDYEMEWGEQGQESPFLGTDSDAEELAAYDENDDAERVDPAEEFFAPLDDEEDEADGVRPTLAN